MVIVYTLAIRQKYDHQYYQMFHLSHVKKLQEVSVHCFSVNLHTHMRLTMNNTNNTNNNSSHHLHRKSSSHHNASRV